MTPYSAVFTQTGNTVTAVALSATYAGTICGSTAVVTGISSSGFNTTTRVVFSDADNAAGTTQYSNGTCSGTDTFTVASGPCVM